MQPSRRQLLELTSLSIAGLAGCANVPGGGEPREAESGNTDQEEAREDSEPEQNETTDEDEEDDTEEVEQPPKLQQRIQTLFEFNRWFVTGYDGTRRQYHTLLSDADRILDNLQQQDPASIDPTRVTSAADLLRDAAGTHNSFEPYYTSHYPLESLANDLETDLTNSLERSEYDAFRDQLRDYERTVGDLGGTEGINDRYPQFIVDQEPYGYFMAENTNPDFDQFTEDGDDYEIDVGGFLSELPSELMYEVFYSSNNREKKYYATPGDMDIERKPWNSSKTIERMEGFGSSDEFNPYNHTIGLQERGGWLSVDAATAEMWIRVPLIHLTYDDFPGEYIPTSVNTATITAADVPTVPFDNVQSVGIYIQQFADAEAAQTALEQITETADPDGTRSLLGLDFQKVFHIGDSETTYADLHQTGEYIIAFDIHEKQWDRRELQDLTDVDFSESGYDLEQELDANASVVEYSSVFKDTFIDVKDENDDE